MSCLLADSSTQFPSRIIDSTCALKTESADANFSMHDHLNDVAEMECDGQSTDASGDFEALASSPRSSFFAPTCSLASLLAPRSSLALLFSPRGPSSFAFLLALPLPRLSQGPPNDLTTRPCCEQSLCKPAAQYREGPVQLNCVISAATDRGSMNELIN